MPQLSPTLISTVKGVEKEMTSVAQSDYHSFSTPLTVDINVGDNWGMLH